MSYDNLSLGECPFVALVSPPYSRNPYALEVLAGILNISTTIPMIYGNWPFAYH